MLTWADVVWASLMPFAVAVGVGLAAAALVWVIENIIER